jgi:hypothetical protein
LPLLGDDPGRCILIASAEELVGDFVYSTSWSLGVALTAMPRRR